MRKPMRVALLLALGLALTGCETVRSVFGSYNDAARKNEAGTLLGGNVQTPGSEPAARMEDRGLGGGLAGDKANASYSNAPRPN
jgi:uncharacterized protein YceK